MRVCVCRVHYDFLTTHNTVDKTLSRCVLPHMHYKTPLVCSTRISYIEHTDTSNTYAHQQQQAHQQIHDRTHTAHEHGVCVTVCSMHASNSTQKGIAQR